MDSTSITPVMPIGGDGLGGGSFMWIFGLIVLLALFNGGGFGFGGGNTATLNADIQRGFDSQNLQAQTRDILSAVSGGTAQAVAATNQSFHDTLMATQGLYNELARDIAALQVGQANQLAAQNACCCETKQLIMQSNYDGAMRDAATNANFTAQIQGVKDLIQQNKIDALEAQISQLQLAQATQGLLRFPSSWTFAGGVFPPVQAAAGA